VSAALTWLALVSVVVEPLLVRLFAYSGKVAARLVAVPLREWRKLDGLTR